MGLVGACVPCAEYGYCGVARPDCHRCQGTGRIIGGDIDGVNPIVVLRAALMGLDAKVDRAVLVEKHLLATEVGEPEPEAVTVPWSTSERAALGRQARALLVDLGLHTPKARKVVTPEQRAERKRIKAGYAERKRLADEAWERRQRERADERRRLKVERAAQTALAQAHPEEFAEEREAQEVFVALEEGFGPYMPPAARRVFEGSR